MNRFAIELKKTGKEIQKHRKVHTDNGALAYQTSGKELLDLNFKVPELRHMPELDLQLAWRQAYAADPVLALRWLFYLRDIRGGLGERRAFKVIFEALDPALQAILIKYRVVLGLPDISKNLPILAHYGRWKDMFQLYDTAPKVVKDAIFETAKFQLGLDLKRMSDGESISLIGKYLPSASASNPERRHNARLFAKYLGVDQKDYQGMVSVLLEYLHVVERTMSRREWNAIDYERVPSAAMKLYKKAFRAHDQERFEEYIEKVKSGKAKIHSETLYPYQIFAEMRTKLQKYLTEKWVSDFGRWHKILDWRLSEALKQEIEVLEAQWNALPAFQDGDRSILFVLDGSGSMHHPCIPGNSEVLMWDVAASLAVKGSETLKGPFRNTFITFSETPRIVDMSSCSSLAEKISLTIRYDEVANTDIERTMKLILDTAVNNHLRQDELPSDLVIISDMQFDAARRTTHNWNDDSSDQVLFEKIIQEFQKYGYTMPRVTFWNVSPWNQTVPLQRSPGGVTLVSGFSINNYKIITNGETDPFEALKSTLMDSRYDPVEEAYNQYASESGRFPKQKQMKQRPSNHKRAVEIVLNAINKEN